MRKNVAARLARERAVRLAERRRREEGQFARLASALSTISRAVGNLDLAVELANDELCAASEEVSSAVRELVGLGYRIPEIAKVVGVDARDLRPGLALSLRRTRRRGQTRAPSSSGRGGDTDERGEPPAAGGEATDRCQGPSDTERTQEDQEP